MATATTTSSRAGSNEWGTKPQKESIPSNWLWVETFVKCLESIFEWWLCRCYSIHTWRFLIRARSWFVSVLISANRLTHTHIRLCFFVCAYSPFSSPTRFFGFYYFNLTWFKFGENLREFKSKFEFEAFTENIFATKHMQPAIDTYRDRILIVLLFVQS